MAKVKTISDNELLDIYYDKRRSVRQLSDYIRVFLEIIGNNPGDVIDDEIHNSLWMEIVSASSERAKEVVLIKEEFIKRYPILELKLDKVPPGERWSLSDLYWHPKKRPTANPETAPTGTSNV